MTGPPRDLVDRLTGGPVLSGLVWHDEVGSTNAEARRALESGAPEVWAVGTDVQTAGRGRLGRTWEAPAGTSLLLSLGCRPSVPADRVGLLPLVAGVALADTVDALLPGVDVALKWPNDLLVAGRKAAGILVEGVANEGAVVGCGVNVDWRGVERPAALAGATSLAEAAGRDVDRWGLLAGLVGVFARRYAEWLGDPSTVLPRYRARCATLGRSVRAELPDAGLVTGRAVDLRADGALIVAADGGRLVPVPVGDVVHLRDAPSD